MAPPVKLNNAEIARRLLEYAQMLRAKGENPFKIRAYKRAAQTIVSSGDSFDELVRGGSDLTQFSGIGKGIAAALREIVLSGKMGQLELILKTVPPEVAALKEYPQLDPKRAARVIKKLQITSVSDLKAKFESGEIQKKFGIRVQDHFRAAFREGSEMLLDDADGLASTIRRYLKEKCGAQRVEIAGDVRRRVETIQTIAVVVETLSFPKTRDAFARFNGGLTITESSARHATFTIPGSINVSIFAATRGGWGTEMALRTGSAAHVEELTHIGGLSYRAKTESRVYTTVGLTWIPPELREGQGEVALAAKKKLPQLVELKDICGDLHMHTTSSDGLNSIEEMAAAAKARGYEYIGITDHSQSLRIAGGLSVEALWSQIRAIDRLNAKGQGVRILKSAEVDILEGGELDYPDDLLAELDYTVCSIHSRFRLTKSQQTERLMRAMDHPAFTILGHATGRQLLKRSGYEIDLARLAKHAASKGCYFEINADPDRLDLSAENARFVVAAGVKLVICTDAHSTSGLGYIRCGIDVARRAGLTKDQILNTQVYQVLRRKLSR